MWDEVKKARDENRRELGLSGKTLTSRIESDPDKSLDPNIFQLTHLNFLDLSSCHHVSAIPADLANLVELTTVVMNGNAIQDVDCEVLDKLKKLKVLNLSSNQIVTWPKLELSKLTILNLAMNKIEEMPPLESFPALAHLDLTGNLLTSTEFVCQSDLSHLAELLLAKNQICQISAEISKLTGLKTLDLSENQLKSMPGELGDCPKLKDLSLQGNPFVDNRFKKMVSQKGSKPVLEYIRNHAAKADPNAGGGKKGRSKKSSKEVSVGEDEIDKVCDIIQVVQVTDVNPVIVVQVDRVKDVRPFIVACVVRNLDLTEGRLKKFIQLQTKLHESICDKRQLATIATHDLSKVGIGDLVYTAKPPRDIKITPLNQKKEYDAQALVDHLKQEAEHLRKEKKRSTISGIHQYLNMLNHKEMFACLETSTGTVISFPPITNSEASKISETTRDVLLEVTSSIKLQTAKEVADRLIKEMLTLDLTKKTEDESTKEKLLQVEQIKTVDMDGNLKVTYPSKTDLPFASNCINVQRYPKV